MTTFLLKLWTAFVRALPDYIVRILLLCALVGAFLLHTNASQRIAVNESAIVSVKAEGQTLKAQTSMILANVSDLAIEVRGYRDDIREQNKLLREQLQQDKKYGKK